MTNTALLTPEYRCPICNGNSARFQTCEYPGCPDGRDQFGWQRHERERGPTRIPEPRGHSFALGVCVTLIIVTLALALFAMTGKAHAAKGYNPDTSQMAAWMESLMRPDMPPEYSCCGRADAYPVSSYYPNPDGSYSVVIADGSSIIYPDGTVRPEIRTGRTLIVPSGKVNEMSDNLGNPTEYSWVFLSLHDHSQPDGSYNIFCFVRQPTGN